MMQASMETLEQAEPAAKARMVSVPQSEQQANTPKHPLRKGKGI